MARINLLPWREEARQQRKKDFGVAIGAALGLTLVAGVGVHLYFVNRIDDQGQRNQRLKQEIAQLARTIKEIEKLERQKADLLSRMNVIQELQESRPEIVHLFEELVVAIPDGVYLNKLDQNGRSVTVEGNAQSNERVSALMRNVEASQWVGKPHLIVIENQDKTGAGLSHFRLSFEQIKPKSGDDEQPS